MSRQAHPIRLVTQRLSSAPPEQLPYIIQSLSETLNLCGDVLSGQEQKSKDGLDLSVQAHKLKTQISSLLEHKSQPSRWAAVILIKTCIEAGGVDILRNSPAWVRGVLGLLGRPEPSATKNVATLTLTRIFLLTHGRPTLLREITTPSIGPFAASCLDSVTIKASDDGDRTTEVHNPLLDTVLQSLIKLVPNHPASLRPFAGRIRTVLAPLLAPTPSNQVDGADKQLASGAPPSISVGFAQRLHALLPHCAAKNVSGEEWSMYVQIILSDIHRTADKIFRGVVEERRQSLEVSRDQTVAKASEDEVSDAEGNELQLPAWQGIYAGCERLVGLLQLLQAYIATKTASTVVIPVGSLFAALGRISSVYAPEYPSSKENEMPLNSFVSREERDSLYSMLPEIHTAAIECFHLLMLRTTQTAMSFAVEILELVSWLFQHTRMTLKSTVAIYHLVCQIVQLIGPSFTNENFSSLRPMLRNACGDLGSPVEREQQPKAAESSEANKNSQNKTPQASADSFLDTSKSISNTARAIPKKLEDAAFRLVSTSLTCLPSGKIPFPIRKHMDQAAVLHQNEKALLASVLNPATSNRGKQLPSLLPFLARQHPDSLSAEALLRPRMPPVRTSKGAPEDEWSEGEEDMASAANLRESEAAAGSDALAFAENQDPAPFTLTEARQQTAEAVGETLLGAGQKDGDPLQSPKRAREPDTIEPAVAPASAVIEPLPKKAKVGPEESSKLLTPTYDVVQQDQLSEPILAATDSPPPVAESSTKVQPPDSDSDLDSNGSFEIPPIVFESSDEEDDDEGGDDYMDDGF